MKLTLNGPVLLLGLFISASSQGNVKLDQKIDRSLRQAQEQKLTYLPQFIIEQKEICTLVTGPENEKCLLRLQNHTREILSCPHSQKRYQEGIQYDEWLSSETFLKNEIVPVPNEIVGRFQKLVSAVKDANGIPFQFNFRVGAYKSKVKNAHAAVDGQIYISKGLWTGNEPLSTDEVTAIIAHEIAHVIYRHGMTLNCMTLEWTGPHFSVKEAQATFQEDFRGSIRFDLWSQLSQRLEFEADATATEILKKAGYDPLFMVQALEKLKPKNEGFTSGSHPDFDLRIQSARKAAQSAE